MEPHVHHTSNDSMTPSLPQTDEQWLILNCDLVGQMSLDELRAHVGPTRINESGHAMWPPTPSGGKHRNEGRHAFSLYSPEVLDYAEEWILRIQFWLNSGAFPKLSEWNATYFKAAAPKKGRRLYRYGLLLLCHDWQYRRILREAMGINIDEDDEVMDSPKLHLITGSDIAAQHMHLVS